MATVIHRSDSAPDSFTKLYRGNWLMWFSSSGSETKAYYSTDQGTSWNVITQAMGKIEVRDSYLFVEDGFTAATFTIAQLSVKAIPVID